MTTLTDRKCYQAGLRIYLLILIYLLIFIVEHYIRVAQINMEKFNIHYSTKNIPIPSEWEYMIQLISEIEKLNLSTFIKEMYVFNSQTCLKGHSLSPKVFDKMVHLTF